MQLGRPIGNYVERIVRDKNGQMVRATFCVYECSGSIKARLIKAEYLENDLPNQNDVAILNGFVQNELHNFIEYIGQIVSPYFTLNTLYFSGSKPRAPTIA